MALDWTIRYQDIVLQTSQRVGECVVRRRGLVSDGSIVNRVVDHFLLYTRVQYSLISHIYSHSYECILLSIHLLQFIRQNTIQYNYSVLCLKPLIWQLGMPRTSSISLLLKKVMAEYTTSHWMSKRTTQEMMKSYSGVMRISWFRTEPTAN